MDILPEIVEATNRLIDALDENGVFKNNPFLERLPLKRKLQNLMQRRWEEFDDYRMSWDEVENVMKEIVNDSVGESIEHLLDKGVLDMSINKKGDILYSINKNFDIDNLLR
jgi:hypothetical protein